MAALLRPSAVAPLCNALGRRQGKLLPSARHCWRALSRTRPEAHCSHGQQPRRVPAENRRGFVHKGEYMGRVASCSTACLAGAVEACAAADVASSPGEPDAGVSAPHIPVLKQQVLDAFSGRELAVFIDGTMGAGGHTCAILQDHPELTLVLGLDVDPTAHKLTRERLLQAFPYRVALDPVAPGAGAPLPETFQKHQDSGMDFASPEAVNAAPILGDGTLLSGAPSATRVHLVRENFSRLDAAASSLGLGLGSVDGILLDIGVSSMQLDEPERGFSFLRPGPLDMRMDPRGALTAADLVNSWPEQELGRLIRDCGEDRGWRALARRIVEARSLQPIESTEQLAQILAGGNWRPQRRTGSSKKRGAAPQIHPATRTFQALRIAVNGELDALASAIPRAASLLKPGGRLAIITFHSLEDRIVKHSFLQAAGKSSDVPTAWGDARREGWQDATFRVVTNKPVIATEEEVALNSRSRSAKLRALERVTK